jgi:hypothetical protein
MVVQVLKEVLIMAVVVVVKVLLGEMQVLVAAV